MGALPPVFIEFLGKTTGVKAAMAETKAGLKGVEAEGSTGFTKMGKIASAAVMGIGVAAGAAAVKTIEMASNFQTEMTKLQTAAGLTTQDMAKAGYTSDSLNQKVLALGSQVGQTGTAMAEALYHPISAGLDLKSSLNVVQYAAEEAKISGSSLEDTTYSLSSVMKAFNMPAGQAKQAMADLNAIVGQGDMRFQDLNESIKNWAPTAAQMGISINSMGSGLAYLTDRGNSAEVASTRLTMGISMMTTPSAKATAMLKGLGLASTDVSASSAAMRQAMEKSGITQNKLAQDLKQPDGLYVALNDLKTSLEKAGVSGTEADSVLSKIFGGGRSDKAVMSLMQNLDGLKTKYEDISKQASGSSFDKAWAKTQQNFSFVMNQMKVSLENLGTSIGLKLLPYATKMAQVFAKAATFLAKHKTVAAALAIVIGGALVFALAAMTAQLYAMAAAAATNPITWIVLGVVALIAGIVELALHWRTVWNGIKSVAEAVGHALVDAWHWVEGAAKAVWDGICSGVKSAWNGIASFFSSAWHMVADPIVNAWHWVKNTTSMVWNAVLDFFKKWWPLLLVIFAAPIAILLAVWNHWHKQITAIATVVWGAIKDYFIMIWDGIKSVALSLWEGIRLAVVQPMEILWGWLRSLWGTISGWLSSAWHGIEAVASALWSSIKAAMINPFMAAYHALSGIVSNIGSAIWNGLVSAWHSVENIGQWFINIGYDIVNGIINGVENAGSALFNSLQNLASGALDAAKSFLGINSPSKVFANVVGMAIPEGIAKGVTDNAHLAHSAVGRLSGNLSNQAVSLGGVGASPALAGFGPSSASGAVVVNVTVQGSVLTERDLRDVVQEQFLQKAGRNSKTWAPYRK